jgi:hypothetical protein
VHGLEPEPIFCTAGECLEEAVVVGSATIEVDPQACPNPSEVLQRFTLPLCLGHAHLLRLENRLVSFDSGLLERDRE